MDTDGHSHTERAAVHIATLPFAKPKITAQEFQRALERERSKERK